MECCGCGACAEVCPKQCIEIKRNENGFFRPIHNLSNCTDCKLCEKVCPMLSSNGNSLDNMKLYSAYSIDNKIRKTSPSGGLGHCLAKKSIENGYHVCGVVFNYDKMQAEHQLASNITEIEQFRGSKYLQSENYPAFSEIIYQMQQEKSQNFIVFGTPCQISGLDLVLKQKKLRDKTILVDIYCNGVPSDIMWKKYLTWLTKKLKINNLSDIENISFRDKSLSWHTYYFHAKSKNSEYTAVKDKDPFLKLFTLSVVNQRACFTCPYRNKSAADIRIGDYWGKRFADSEDGVSMVLIGTEKGCRLIDSIKNDAVFMPQDINERFSQQHTDFSVPKFYEKSFEVLKDDKKDITSVVNLYETGFDRVKKRIKKVIKSMLGKK